MDVQEAGSLAEQAYIYGYAIVENYKAMFSMAVSEGSPVYSGFNRYLHGRTLFDADYTAVVNANNDTLYSTAFADIRMEPLVISVPPTEDRYFVIQLVDMATDNFAYIGTRSTGRDGGDFLLLGPGHRGQTPDGPWTRVLSSPSEFVALATRTAIAGAADLPGVIAVQDGLKLRTLSEFRGAAPLAPLDAVAFPLFDPSVYGTPRLFELLNFLLPFHSASRIDDRVLNRISAIGVGGHQVFDLDRFGGDIRRAIEAGTMRAQRLIEERGNSLGAVVDGWQQIPRMGTYGDDYLFRAAVAWKFIYTNSPEEALYPIAETDSDGEPLSGDNRYQLRFAPGHLPPVEAFWSITLYDSESRLMVHNPIERYSIGDRTPGLRYGDDGSLTLFVQHQSPAPELMGNWLPAPKGRFYLNVRAYIPSASMIDGTYRLPAVSRVAQNAED